MGAAWERHAMCESALRNQSNTDVFIIQKLQVSFYVSTNIRVKYVVVKKGKNSIYNTSCTRFLRDPIILKLLLYDS